MPVQFYSVRRVMRHLRSSAIAITAVSCAGLLGAGLLAAQPAQASEWNTALQMHSQERANHARGETAPREGVRSRFGIGRRPLGRAPYVCTPSGFGRTATCYLRGSTNSALN